MPQQPARPGLQQVLADLNAAAESVWQAVVPSLPGLAVEVLSTVDSSNSELMRRARQGVAEPVLLVAAQQTAGRGRRERVWVSRPGAALTFSLGLPLQPPDWSGLSLAVGVSLAEAIHADIGLKWPNDLWWQERKLGGILVETAHVGAGRYAVIGVGLNLTTPDLAQVPAGADGLAPTPATGLDRVNPELLESAGAWLLRVAPPLVQDVLEFERHGFAAFQSRFDRRDVLRGRAVRLCDGQEGWADGVGADGVLWLRGPNGRTAVLQHEVSVRPC